MADLKDLERFAPETKDVVKVGAIQPLDHIGMTGRILAFDQSLANTGWCLIEAGKVLKVGNIKTGKMDKGPEDTFLRGTKVYEEVKVLMRTHLWAGDTVAHEMPAVSRRAQRPEASYVAAMGVRAAAHDLGMVVEMVSAQKAKKRWTGSAQADKAVVKASLLHLHPYLEQITPMNQAISDAIALGMVVAEKQSMEKQ